VRLYRRQHERTVRRASLPTREQLVPGEDKLLSHYRSTIGCRFIRQWYTASAEPRRRVDKTSGRKRPRAGDVDIVPAGDMAMALTATITANQQQQQPPPGPPSPTPADVEPSSPPAPSSPTPTFLQAGNAGRRYKGARPKSRIINWLQCDTCRQWLHNVCAGVGRTTPAVGCLA